MGIAFQVEIRHFGIYRGRVAPHRVPAVVGSSRTADVQLADDSVASQHAEIVEGPDGMVLVRDLGGPGGVRVNGMRLRNAEIRPGDVIEIGNFAMVVVEAHQTREIVDRETWVDLPSSRRDEGSPAIEMYVLWHDKVLDVRHFTSKKQSYRLSERPGADLLLPDGLIGDKPDYTLIGDSSGDVLSVNVSNPGLSGEVRLRSGQVMELSAVKAQAGGVLQIEPGVRARIDLGPFTFLVQGTNSGPKPKRFGISRDVATVLLILALSFLGHSGFMVAVELYPEDGLSLSRTDYETRHGVVEVLKIAYEPDEPEEVEPEIVKARRVDDDGDGHDDNDLKSG